VTHHQSKDVGAASAEGDADAELACSRRDGVGDDAVDPNQRDNERQSPEHVHHRRDLRRPGERLGDGVLQRHDAECGKQGIDTPEFRRQESR
jgi:hypothetical protein